MEETSLPISIYVDIDSLFDTRLPVLKALSDETAIAVLEDGSYHTRFKNNFKNISSDIFNTMYKARNKNVLVLSTPTEMFDYLINYILDMETDLQRTERMSELVLYINTYPYNLDAAELESMGAGISNAVRGVPIKFINVGLDDLLPEWLSENVETVIMYDMIPWIEYHTATQALIRTPLSNKICIGPSLIDGNIKDKDIDQQYFKTIQEALAPLVGYVPLQTSFYSSAIIKKKKVTS